MPDQRDFPPEVIFKERQGPISRTPGFSAAKELISLINVGAVSI
jgi:hypothetical protein